MYAGLLLELDIDLVRDLNGPAYKASCAERSDVLEGSLFVMRPHGGSISAVHQAAHDSGSGYHAADDRWPPASA